MYIFATCIIPLMNLRDFSILAHIDMLYFDWWDIFCYLDLPNFFNQSLTDGTLVFFPVVQITSNPSTKMFVHIRVYVWVYLIAHTSGIILKSLTSANLTENGSSFLFLFL